MCYHAALRYSSVSTIMKFPGKRKSKHYFPVNARDPLLQQIQPEQETNASWVVGIDQTLVDIEAKVDDDFITRYGLSAGHSLVIEDEVAEKLYQELTRENLITHQFAGGTIGNTMHNYSVLADDRSVLLGVMCSNIEIGSYAYRYLCNIQPYRPELSASGRWSDWPLFHADWRIRRAYFRYQPRPHESATGGKYSGSGDRWRLRAGVDLISGAL